MLHPFRSLAPEAGLVVFGILTGCLALLIFKATSRPERVARARQRALSRVLELWLFRHDPLIGLGSIGRMAADNLRYFATLLIPMACSLPPMLLLLAQGHDWFAARAPAPGEPVLLVARLHADAGHAPYENLALVDAEGRVMNVPRVASTAWGEVAWRLTAPAPGAAMTPLRLHLDGAVIAKEAVFTPGLARRSPVRAGTRLARLLYPGETPLPHNQPLQRITLRLPAAEYNLLGWRTSWLWGLLAVSLATGWLLKKPLDVEF